MANRLVSVDESYNLPAPVVAVLDGRYVPGTGGISEVTYALLPAGSTLTVSRTAGVYPNRPTNRTDIIVRWRGDVPPTVGGNYAIDGVDAWENTAP